MPVATTSPPYAPPNQTGQATFPQPDLHCPSTVGALVALGGIERGWTFSIQNGKLDFHYNRILITQYQVVSDTPVPTGKVKLVADFAYDGGGVGKGATVTLSANRAEIGKGRVDLTTPLLYGTDGFDIGGDFGSAVSPDYQVPFLFTGTLEHVTIDLL